MTKKKEHEPQGISERTHFRHVWKGKGEDKKRVKEKECFKRIEKNGGVIMKQFWEEVPEE